MAETTETVCDVCGDSLAESAPPLWRCPSCNAVPRQRHFHWVFRTGKLRPDREDAAALCIAESGRNQKLLATYYKQIVSGDLHGRDRRRHLSGVDIRNLAGFADGSFDLVTAIGVLDYVDDAAGAFRSVARVLRPGGLFLFHILPHLLRRTNDPPTLKGVNLTSDKWFSYLPAGMPISTYYYGIEWIVGALADAGLTTEVLKRTEAGGTHHWFLARRAPDL